MKELSRSYLALILCCATITGQMPEPALAFSPVQAKPKVVALVNAHNEDLGKPGNTVRLMAGTSARSPMPRANIRKAGHRSTSQSSSTAPLQLPGQSATLMSDGRILLLGGETSVGPITTALLRDPKTGATTQLANGLQKARAWHTATTLPNGSILIFGGTGVGDKTENTAEIFDPSSGRFQLAEIKGLKPRSSHTATLLIDGRVLIAGGVDEDGKTAGALEAWDFRSGEITSVASMGTPRSKHTATLLPDGTVLLWGGVNANGVSLDYGEIFDPGTQALRVQASLIQPQNDPQPPQLAQSIPQDGSTDVAPDTLIGLRFSKPLNVVTVASGTTLSGPQGLVDAKIVAAEGGMLAFIGPAQTLAAGTSYTLSLQGMMDNSSQALPDSQIVFTTAGVPNGSGGGVIGTGSGGGVGDPQNSPWRNLPPLQAKAGVTALAGQVLGLDGEPIGEVTLEIEGVGSTRTDGTGRFLLTGMTAGHNVMWIDGTTANTPKKSYGIFEVGIDSVSGKTNALNYTIWMPLLDMEHAVPIPSPTQSEVVVKTPALPGLELHIPPQTTILDRKGKVVTEVSITPVPLRQPPFPLPKDVLVPLYFTIQPGGAYIQVASPNGPQGAQLYYPNTYHYPAGAISNFYNYDPDVKGWYVYGFGKVSADRSQVVPNPGVVIYEFTGAMVSNFSNAPFKGPKPPGCPSGEPADPRFPAGACTPPKRSDPVDVQTGLFVYNKTDLFLPDVIPLVLTRTYRQDDYISRAFGIGTNHNYDIFLVGDNNGRQGADGNPFPEGYTYQDLILPDGGRIHFTRTSPCTGQNGFCGDGDGIFTALSTTTDFYGATIHEVGGGAACGFTGAIWCLQKKDGTVYGFADSDNSTIPQAAAPLGMRDRYGNTLMFTRDTNHNLTQITSPNGRYIKFTYDGSNRITQAQDNVGRTVLYTYDTPCGTGLLCKVTDANSGQWIYTYDLNNNMTTIKDPRQIVYLTNFYDANNRVYKQVEADNSTYLFSYTLDSIGNVTQANTTDPNGNVEQAVFNSDGYMTSDTFALGKPEQQTFTYSRQTNSGLVQNFTDPLGRQSTLTYDNMGNLTSVTLLAGTANAVTTSYAYEPTFNQLTAVTDPLGHTGTIKYDGNGNAISVVDPLGSTSSLTYNSSGQPISVTDSAGNTTQLTYDSGDLVGITDSLGRTVTRFVDPVGRLSAITDPLGRNTRYAYNPLNQITSVTDPKGNLTQFGYDANGNLQSVTDANTHQTQYTYDNMDRVLTRKDALLNQECYGTVSGGVCQSNGYDGNGNLVQFTDRRGKVAQFSYDGLNRLTFAGFGWTSGTNYESTVNYSYGSATCGTLQCYTATATDSISGAITRTDDALNRLASETTTQGTVSYTYDNAGRRASLTVPGQSVVNYTFDNGNRLTQIAQGTTTVGFTYDNANRRATLTLPNGVVTSYSYDTASQLTGMTYALGGNPLGNLSYGYDNDGRRSSVTGNSARTGLPLAMNTMAYNANNQLTTWGTASLFYDLNGNMTSDGTHSYTWDARNRLTQMDSGNTASFSYDASGRRISKTVLSTQTGFFYDGANAVQELSGSTPTANLLSGGIDEVFQRTDSAGARSFLTDALGSTLALTDSTGTTQTSYTFEPFGNTTATGSASTNSFAYTGRELDATGLYYYRARYYSPMLQRFISEDPQRFESGVNFYSYSQDSPTALVDPTGMSQQDVQTIIAKAAELTNLMVDAGLRYDGSGEANNALATLQYIYDGFALSPQVGGGLPYVIPYLGCGEQASFVISGLTPLTPSLDAVWTFDQPEEWGTWEHPTPHQWLSGHSSNPNDPSIVIDPWNDQYQIVPPGGTPDGAKWQRLRTAGRKSDGKKGSANCGCGSGT